jgi:hypothetical protein
MRRGQKKTTKTTLRSEWRGALKKNLTGPTLLEMSGLRFNQELASKAALVRFVVFRGLPMEPNHSNPIQSTKHSCYEKKQSNDDKKQIFAKVFEVNLVLYSQESRYRDGHSHK